MQNFLKLKWLVFIKDGVLVCDTDWHTGRGGGGGLGGVHKSPKNDQVFFEWLLAAEKCLDKEDGIWWRHLLTILKRQLSHKATQGQKLKGCFLFCFSIFFLFEEKPFGFFMIDDELLILWTSYSNICSSLAKKTYLLAKLFSIMIFT